MMNQNKSHCLPVILLILIIPLIGHAAEKEQKRFSLFLNSGSGLLYVNDHCWEAKYNPGIQVGCGIGYNVFNWASLELSVDYYCFRQHDKYCYTIWVFDIPIHLEEPIYVGNATQNLVDVILKARIKPFKLGRFSPFITAGGGMSFGRYPIFFTLGMDGFNIYFNNTRFMVAYGGIGSIYTLSSRFDLFIEAGAHYRFFKKEYGTRHYLPLKVGIMYKF